MCALAMLAMTIIVGVGAARVEAAPGMTEGSAMPVTGFEVVSAGHGDTVFGLQTNGSLTAWGANANGQTGDGGTTNRSTPGFTFASDSTFVGVKQVAVGDTFTAVLKADGSVWAWGSNANGELGDGTGVGSATPVAVTGMTNVRQIAAGAAHGLALKADGTVWAWGTGVSGELGNGAGTSSNSPVQVDFSGRAAGTLRLARAIYAGTDYSMAIMSDGAVWGWGVNAKKQLAIATTADKLTPQAANAALNGARSIALGDVFGAAIMGDGNVLTWGNDTSGQLGNGATTGNQSTPQVTGVTKALQVVAGDDHVVVLKADGTVTGWGSNAQGQLGFAGADQTSPMALASFGAAGSTRYLAASLNATFQVQANGTVRGTGENTSGQLATGTFVSTTAPTASNYTCGCGSFVKVVSGGYHSAGIKSDGTFWMWGEDSNEQLGNGPSTNTPVLTPQTLSVPTGVRTVALARYSTMAIANDGQVYGWGRGVEGQLGLPVSPGWHDTPTVIPGLAGGARDLVANYDSMAVLMADGTVMTFGDSNVGQVANGGANGIYATPTAVPAFANARALVGGRYINYALMPDGTVTAAGQGNSGEFGNGAAVNTSTPTTVAQLFGTLNLAGGAYFTMSIGADGMLSASGTNLDGELGQRADRLASYKALTPEPVQLVPPPATQPPVVSLAVGRSHIAATGADGLVHTWGVNGSGQLGRSGNTMATWAYPAVLLQGGSPMLVRNITMGGYNSIALTRDGTFYTWGDNSSGQLGNGSTTGSASPIFVSSGCALPADPAPVNQFLADGTTVIPSGGWGSDAGVVLTFSTTDPDTGESLTPWVEVTTGAFAGTCGQASATTFSGAPVVPSSQGATTQLSVTVAGLTNLGSYNWRACVVDQANQRTSWTSFPGGPPDFRIKTSEPLLPTLVSPVDNGSTTSTTPSLTATYTDTAPLSGGTINFAIGTSATCGVGLQRSGNSANGIVSGNDGSWSVTPALPNGTYYWCAQDTDAAGNISGFTTTRKLVIGAASMTITTSTPTLGLGSVQDNVNAFSSFTVNVTTDALTGYQLQATDASDASALSCACGGAIADWTGTGATPTAWSVPTAGYGGLTVRDATGGRLAKWGAGTGTAENDFASNKYAGLKTTATLLHERTTYSAATDGIVVTTRVHAAAAQQAGAYTTTILLTAVANP